MFQSLNANVDRICILLMVGVALTGCGQSPLPTQETPLPPTSNSTAEIIPRYTDQQEVKTQKVKTMSSENSQTETATFGSGCFWCTEAVFRELKGVQTVKSGYSGGSVLNPTYELVTTGQTGHAEVIQVTFDPAQISYADLLRVFWQTHDPTTLNRQGADKGTQYRSIVLYHSDEQMQIAQAYKQQLQESGNYKDPIVTQIEPFKAFFPAESYHHEYFDRNPEASYCQFIIRPKVEKFRSQFSELLKTKENN